MKHEPQLLEEKTGIGRHTGSAGRVIARGMILLVRFYQFGIGPHLIGTCKFAPSCSQYFIEAVQRHGAVRGGWLGMRRLLRCHPFSAGGIDPVP